MIKMKTFKILVFSGLLSLSISALGQGAPPPPPPGGGSGGNQNQNGGGGGGAPVGGGLGILLALGAAYGGKKIYTAYTKQIEE